jgi:hypothetical protein
MGTIRGETGCHPENGGAVEVGVRHPFFGLTLSWPSAVIGADHQAGYLFSEGSAFEIDSR